MTTKRMLNIIHRSVLGALIIGLVTPMVVCADWYMTTPSGYQKMGGASQIGPYSSKPQCESVNQQYFHGNGSCHGSDSSAGGGFGGVQPGGSLEQQLLGTIFNSFMQGFMQGLQGGSQNQPELEQQRQQELKQQQRALQEELERQAAARRRAEEAWLRERNQAYATLKGPKPPDSLELKGPKSVDLGIKGMQSADLDIKDIASPSRDKRDLSTQWKRLHCATYLSEMANKAAEQGKPDEASYLTEQAAQAMAGGALGVQCPEAPAPPPVITQKASPQDQFYTALMQTTKDHLGQLQAAEKQLAEEKQKKEEADKKVEERRQDVERLQQTPPSSDQPQPDPNLLAEAQRLLHEAEGEMTEATQAYNDAQKQYQDATAALQRDKSLYETVQANPQAAQNALIRLQK